MILLIDEDQIWQEILIKYFFEARIPLTIRDTGYSALNYLQANKPELVMMDFDLPDVSGSVFLKKLRGYESCADLPVIILTNTGNIANLESSMEYGVSDYLLKPETSLAFLISRIYALKNNY